MKKTLPAPGTFYFTISGCWFPFNRPCTMRFPRAGGSNELLLLHLKKATTNIIHKCCVGFFLVKMFKDPSTATWALIGTAMSILV